MALPNELTPDVALLCDATEEWAQHLDTKATDLTAHGQEGRRAAAILHGEAQALRETVSRFRPLRRYDPDTDDWRDPDTDDWED